MAETQNRTLICTVLFVDIVEYSRKPVVEQLRLKDRFNELLTDALREVAFKDRVIIDTGDGAACTFTGDPEDALFVATRLQESIAREAESEMSQLSARMGINLGPVRLVKDINGQPNVIGDAINVSQRIMNFAQPGQVLVSHSYYEAVSRLSGESSNLFTYQGSRTDKHIRDHEVYALSLSAAAEQRRSNDERRAARAREVAAASTPLSRAAALYNRVHDLLRAKPHWSFSAGLIVAVVFFVGYQAYQSDMLGPVATTVAATMPLQPAPGVAKLEPSAPETGTQAPAPAMAPAPEPAAAPAPAAIVATAPAVALPPEPAPAASAAPQERAVKVEPKRPEVGVVDLAIAPWGTVYIDGKERGASPPLRELKLKEGKHKVEVKNGSFPDHVVLVNVKAGERLKIKHKFR